jgi:hypothetical protein
MEEPMAEIIHTVEMHTSPAAVYRALVGRTEPNRGGFTKESCTAPRIDAVGDFRFGDGSIVARMRVSSLQDGARVAWTCVDGPDEWMGTFVTFDLVEAGEETIVRFGHRGWKAASDFMGRTSASWARFLFALKTRLEMPDPEDVYA